MAVRNRERTERREALPLRPRRTLEKRGGRTNTTETPLSIRILGVETDSTSRDYLRVRLGYKLGKFALRIRRVSVRLIDESGPKGAPLCACRIKVVLDPVADVIVEHRDAEIRTSVDGAVDRAERSVRRALQKVRARVRVR